MRVKLDENLPLELGEDIRAAGHDADHVVDEGLAGGSDSIVLSAARDEGRVLFTMDKGIADIRQYPPADYAGIVLFRPPSTGRGATLSFAREHLPGLLQLDLGGRLVVITRSGLRVRN